MHERPIDLDDQSTWPPRLLAVAAGQNFDPELEDWRELLEGRPLRTYHATRLLPHEAVSIRSVGLRALTRALLETRIEEAETHGYIGQAQADEMRSSNTFARHRTTGRLGIVCSIMGRAALRNPADTQGLLCCWGGEALHGHDREVQRLVSTIGTPSLVVLDHPFPADVRTNLFPSLVQTFRETYRDPQCGRADVVHHGSVPAASVVDVLDAELAATTGQFPELAWLRDQPRPAE